MKLLKILNITFIIMLLLFIFIVILDLVNITDFISLSSKYDWLGFVGTYISGMATLILGIISIKQNETLSDVNKKMLHNDMISNCFSMIDVEKTNYIDNVNIPYKSDYGLEMHNINSDITNKYYRRLILQISDSNDLPLTSGYIKKLKIDYDGSSGKNEVIYKPIKNKYIKLEVTPNTQDLTYYLPVCLLDNKSKLNELEKSTFLKILAGEIEPNKGEVILEPNKRLSMLKQDHFAYDDKGVVETVIMGNKRLYEIMQEKEKLYAKPDFNDEDGIRLGELEGEFAEMDGWNAEVDAEILLNGLGISSELHDLKMKELDGNQKVKVLLAQALFGNPDVLLLDEPTNHLDLESIRWLENFLMNFKNTVIVVSHDRYFLNKVCTHIADIDYSKIQLYVGNYDFWYEYSQLQLQQAKDQNKKAEAKKKELEEFIARFSANASKAKQATSRKKLLDNLEMVDIKPSLRRYPFISFKPGREVGNIVLKVEGLSKTVEGVKLLNNVSFSINPKDKVAFVGDVKATEVFFKIIMGEMEPDEGTYQWGVTTSQSYFPKDNSKYFNDCDLSLVDWLRQFSVKDEYEQDLRGWLGRMLFSGEEALKKASVLSGGEKVRCMLAKMMMAEANVLVLDEPTNHLDLESIQALNQGLINFKENILFTSHDHQFVQTIANRIIEFNETGILDRLSTYDEYLEYKENNK